MRDVFLEALNEAFDLTVMLEKINYHHVRGNLTDKEREELITRAREKADPMSGLNIANKLRELDERVTALEKGGASTGGSNAAEYEAGRWYYAGDMVTFGGKTYKCIAPAGAVCTWSPAEYPAYWEAQ